MRALLTDEQRDLATMVSAFAATFNVSSQQDLATIDRQDAWERLSEAGLVALRQRDNAGMPEGSGVEVALTAEGLSRQLVPVPFLTSGIMAVELLEASGADRDIVEQAANGHHRYAVALTRDLVSIAGARSQPAVAVDAEDADYVLFCSGAEDGVRRVARPAQGRLNGADLTRPLYEIDATCCGDAEIVGGPLSADGYRRWIALSLTALASDIVGTLQGALDRVVDYSHHRVQFGVPIGSFQAIQHMCAGATAKVQAAWSSTKYAAWTIDELDADSALLASREAKAYASAVARDVSETVMQVYGGIGQTWESIAHVQLRRALLDRALLGNENVHLDAIADAKLTRN